jgi:hypothetical protein
MVNLASLVAIINVLQGQQIKQWAPQRAVETQLKNSP